MVVHLAAFFYGVNGVDSVGFLGCWRTVNFGPVC